MGLRRTAIRRSRWLHVPSWEAFAGAIRGRESTEARVVTSARQAWATAGVGAGLIAGVLERSDRSLLYERRSPSLQEVRLCVEVVAASSRRPARRHHRGLRPVSQPHWGGQTGARRLAEIPVKRNQREFVQTTTFGIARPLNASSSVRTRESPGFMWTTSIW